MMLLGVAASASSAPANDPAAAVRERVLAFAKANLGKTVGNGECAALAFRALKAAGAKPRAPYGFPTPRDYVWGELVLLAEGTPNGPKMTGSLNDVQPGDVAQFGNVKFARAHMAHHTAVVADISPTRLGLLEQHVGGQRIVVLGSVRLDKLATGWIRFYRPIPLTH